MSESDIEAPLPMEPPPPGWPNQRPVVDGVQEVSQDPELFADEDEADEENGDVAGEEA